MSLFFLTQGKIHTSKHFLTKRLIFCLIFITLLMPGCSQESNSPKVQHKQLFTFGTLIDISIVSHDKEATSQAIDMLSLEFDRLHTLWHPWKGTALTQTNQKLSSALPFKSAPSIIELIQQSQRLSELSDGLFNPAIGHLIKLWQFDQLDNEAHQFNLPSDQSIKALLHQKPGMADIQILSTPEGQVIQSTNPSVALDFGAFAKGAAIEAMMDKLKEQNIFNALINAGGDLKVLGLKGEKPWRIGIKNPDHSLNKSHQPVLAAINLNNEEALFTSGNYERFFEYQGKRYHHIIDPITGYPATGTRSVTVLAEDAGLADAASTALFIAGPERWETIAKKMGIKHVMLIADDNTIYLSSAMAERIEILSESKPVIVKL